jgi:carbonic anhydrase/acetyltransferase-like protein (isoleucine patch superfamily)
METKNNASFVARRVMVLGVIIAHQRLIGMEAVVTNADGVVLLRLVVGVIIAHQRVMKDNSRVEIINARNL